jgi:flavin-dependent dehydrogenase
MVRMKYDVIVVGAGSAGLTAARIISSSGFRVAPLPSVSSIDCCVQKSMEINFEIPAKNPNR